MNDIEFARFNYHKKKHVADSQDDFLMCKKLALQNSESTKYPPMSDEEYKKFAHDLATYKGKVGTSKDINDEYFGYRQRHTFSKVQPSYVMFRQPSKLLGDEYLDFVNFTYDYDESKKDFKDDITILSCFPVLKKSLGKVMHSYRPIDELPINGGKDLMNLEQKEINEEIIIESADDYEIRQLYGSKKLSLYLKGKLVSWVWVSDTGYIYYLETKDNARGKGFASILINKAINELGGYWLHVEPGNLHVIDWYKRLGFKLVEPKYNYLITDKVPWTYTFEYVKLMVLAEKLEDYNILFESCKGDLKKMLGNLSRIAYEEIMSYESEPSVRTKYDDKGNIIKKEVNEALQGHFELPDEYEIKWLEDKIKEHNWIIDSHDLYGDDEDYPGDIHYQIRDTKEFTLDIIDDVIEDSYNWLSSLLDEFEDTTGCPCTCNVGATYKDETNKDILIPTAGFDIRPSYWREGEETFTRSSGGKIKLHNGQIDKDDKITQATIKDIQSHMDISDDEIETIIPTNHKKESLEESINNYKENSLIESISHYSELDEESLEEKIVKKGNKYQVQSEKGRNMGTYDTKEKAKKRLQQVHYFKYKNESLDKATPYMLRNDGELLTCGDIHPYIKYLYEENNLEAIKELFKTDDIKWFYNNTNKEDTRKQIINFLFSLINCSDIDEDTINSAKEIIKDLGLKEPDANIIKGIKQVENLYEELNTITNQEFCRIRMSNLKYGGTNRDIYCRISSLHFNWFPLIWDIISNQNINTVTICRDTQTFGGKYEPYKVGGIAIDNLPKDTFLTLKGNPTIEKLDFKSEMSEENFKNFQEGLTLSESCFHLHPKYALGFYKTNIEEKLTWDINNILQPNNINEAFHGSTEDFEFFNTPIAWFTIDEDYAGQYISWIKSNGYIYVCKLEVDNTIDVGDTSLPVFLPLPLEEQYTPYYIDFLKKIGVSEEEFKPILKKIQYEFDCEGSKKGRCKLHTIVRSTFFANFMKEKGYDGVKTIEDNHLCFGIWNKDKIQILSKKKFQ